MGIGQISSAKHGSVEKTIFQRSPNKFPAGGYPPRLRRTNSDLVIILILVRGVPEHRIPTSASGLPECDSIQLYSGVGRSRLSNSTFWWSFPTRSTKLEVEHTRTKSIASAATHN